MEVEKPSFLQGLHRVSRTDGRPCKTTRNNRRVFRMPRRSIKDASVARLDNLKTNSAQTKPRGKSKEGGRSPLLGRFKGDCQGGESKLPLDYAFFRPSTALSFSYEKESGVENTLTEAFRSTKKTAGGVPAVSCFLTAPDKRPASRRYTSAASARRGYLPRRSA